LNESPKNPFEPFFAEVRRIVREEVAAALHNGNGKTPAAEKDWLKANEAAELYGLPKTWFEERGRAGDIARTKPGRYTLFQRRDIEAYLERNKGTDWPKHKRKKKEDLTSPESGTT
jgi:helix-turn-helix protein